MSALGHKRTFAAQKVMSALPPKADMCSANSGCLLSAKSGHTGQFGRDAHLRFFFSKCPRSMTSS